jgi:hypothetical protein
MCGESIVTNCRRCGRPNIINAVYCGYCGVNLSEATFGIASDEVDKWRDSFAALGWLEEVGPKTKVLLAQSTPPVDENKEPIIFLTYDDAKIANRIEAVRLSENWRPGKTIGILATNWRLIIIDTDNMHLHIFSYENISTVEKPVPSGGLKTVRYIVHQKTGAALILDVRLDAPGSIGILSGFSNPTVATRVMAHAEKASGVVGFLNQYFTRIVPWH